MEIEDEVQKIRNMQHSFFKEEPKGRESNRPFQREHYIQEKAELEKFILSVGVQDKSLLGYCNCTTRFGTTFIHGNLFILKSHIGFQTRVPINDVPTKEGVLELEVDSGVVSKWKEYFVVLDDQNLTYYNQLANQDICSRKACISLRSIQEATLDHITNNSEQFFFVKTRSTTYRFSAMSDEDALDWVKSINSKLVISSNRNCSFLIALEDIKSIQLINSSLCNSGIYIQTREKEFLFGDIPERKRMYSTIHSQWESIGSAITRLKGQQFKGKKHLGKQDANEISEYQLHTLQRNKYQPMINEFHFKFRLPDEEKLLYVFKCGWCRGFRTYNGRLYISENYLCFDAETVVKRITINFSDINTVTQTRKCLFWYAIEVYTSTGKHLFCNFLKSSEALSCIREVLDSYLVLIPQESDLSNIIIDRKSEISRGKFEITSCSHIGLKVLIFVVGSRGDVQPFIAFALRLVQCGYNILIATHEVHRGFVESYGLSFTAIFGDPKVLMRFMVEYKLFVYSLIKGEKSLVNQFFRNLFESQWQVCKRFRPQIILENPPSMAGIHISERMKVPLIECFTMPWSRTKDFAHPLIPPSSLFGKTYNYYSHVMVSYELWYTFRRIINHFRTRTLGLQRLSIWKGPNLQRDRKTVHLYCYSPSVLPKPEDWQDFLHVVGYWFLDTQSTWSPPVELLHWLSQGSKPIYIGFGSVTVSNPKKVLNIILKSLKKTNQRAVIATGWGLEMDMQCMCDISNDIYVTESIPHDWLFQRCQAVIHHGGSGTLAAGLVAGVPTLVVPFFADQFLWGNRVVELGVGLAPLQVNQLTVSKLSSAILTLVTDKGMQERAQLLSQKIKNENGLQNAVNIFNSYVAKWAH